ncbi:MAG: hypothetical protein IKP04_02235 [Candidatus Methanomethylophilaceae archaeon]|nr:hypothetical protein [Candidatus Methanomethylophilaceae archaeon]
MAVIDLVCSKCGANIELDDSREFGFCSFCGNRVLIQQDNSKKKAIVNLNKLLDAATSSDNDDEILRIANKILELDSNHADAWFWKGYVLISSFDLSGGLACWSNYVENTTIDDLKDSARVMAKTIGINYFLEDKSEFITRSSTDGILDLSVDIDYRFFEVMPEEYYFTTEVLKNMGDCIIESEDVDDILNGCTKIDMLLFNAFTYYPLMDFFYYAASSLVPLLESARMNNGRKSFDEYEPEHIRKVYNRIGIEIELFQVLSIKSKAVFESISDDDLNKLYDYWTEQDMDYFFDTLNDIHDLSMDMKSGLFGNKNRKIRDQKIVEFFDSYLKPLS